MTRVTRLVQALLAIVLLGAAFPGGASVALAAEQPETCPAAGSWLDPATGTTRRHDALMAELATRAVVLLGERHDDAADHRWQLHMLAGLHALHPDMVIGFEMFPRRVQGALDDWVAGRLDERAFLEQSEWSTVWGFGASLYLPLFHFARQHGIPMVALNVERALVSRVGREGWAAVPDEAKEGVSDPAEPDDAYRRALARVYAAKLARGIGGGHSAPTADDPSTAPEPDMEAILADDDFARFVAAQLTWDRAMADALAAAHRARPNALVVGVIGRGHLEHGHGVPHQLADLGVHDAAVLLPIAPADACAPTEADLAEALFVVEPDRRGHAAGKPRLGVMIEGADGGVRVMRVVDGSVAARAGLEAGDIVLSAAGAQVETVGDLITIVQRQAPGTWLPLAVKRDTGVRVIIAEFPPNGAPGQTE